MTSILCLNVILLLFAVQFTKQQKFPCDSKDNCDPNSASLAVIKCDKSFGPGDADPCVCEPGGTACPQDIVDETPKYGDIDENDCSDFCKTTTDCSFWKYTNIIEGTKQTSCYLMKSDECDNLDTSIKCPDLHDDGSVKCKSDVIDENQCQDGTLPAPAPGENCVGPITPIDNTDGKKYVQKWECFNPDPDAANFIVDMYQQDATMPLGGWCTLLVEENGGSCKKTDQEFKFTCKLDSEKAVWTKETGIAEDDVTDVMDGDKLKDVECTATHLDFDNAGLASQTGRTIVCSKGGVTEDSETPGAFFIPAENYCHMFCDDFDVLSFYTDWNNGASATKRGWFYKVSGGTAEPMENADILDCWGKRF